MDVAFFFAEFGDKTQVATLMLAARYDDLVAVVGGSTLGMLRAVRLCASARSAPRRCSASGSSEEAPYFAAA